MLERHLDKSNHPRQSSSSAGGLKKAKRLCHSLQQQKQTSRQATHLQTQCVHVEEMLMHTAKQNKDPTHTPSAHVSTTAEEYTCRSMSVCTLKISFNAQLL
jgi:hypothetical protein